ncbi:MAG: hypothetical protein U0Q12_00615 [Vicinamibacterales bacterium]
MALAERAAFDVFTGEADGDAVLEDRRECELLGRRPVDGSSVGCVEHRAPTLPPFSSFGCPTKVDGRRSSASLRAVSRSSGTAVLA